MRDLSRLDSMVLAAWFCVFLLLLITAVICADNPKREKLTGWFTWTYMLVGIGFAIYLGSYGSKLISQP
jgi:ABC-type multidrug transport system permease subunit